MAASKLGKYIQTDVLLKGSQKTQPDIKKPVLIMGSIEGLSACDYKLTWWPVSTPLSLVKETHYHDFEQYLMFTGGDANDLTDLGGEVEIMLGENENEMERFVFTKAAMVFVPPKLWHGPCKVTKVNDPNKPVLFYDIFMTNQYVRNIGNP